MLSRSFVLDGKGYCITRVGSNSYNLFSPKGSTVGTLREIKEILQREVPNGDIGDIDDLLSIFAKRGDSNLLDCFTRGGRFIRKHS